MSTDEKNTHCDICSRADRALIEGVCGACWEGHADDLAADEPELADAAAANANRAHELDAARSRSLICRLCSL